MSGRPEDARLVLALDGSRDLGVLEPDGSVRRVSAGGYARFPAARPGGGLAYVAITDAPGEWQVVVVVLDERFEPIDMLPGAAVFAPPSWSEDGSSLVFLRGDSLHAEAVEWTAEDGSFRTLIDAAGLRSAVRTSPTALLYSAGGEVLLRDGTAAGERVAVIPAAAGFREFGSDDLFATIDQLSVSPDGTIAAVERWYRQGIAPHERIVLVADGALDQGALGRFPRWASDGRLLYTSETGEAVIRDSPPVDVADDMVSHSAEWLS